MNTGTIVPSNTGVLLSSGHTRDSLLTISGTSHTRPAQPVATQPFINGFPAWDKFNQLCKQYPTLQKQCTQMMNVYTICTSELDE
jgi:hypothetical protein